MVDRGSVDTRVRIGDLVLRNPVMPASGTFAEGLAPVVPFERLGALVTKTVTAELRGGNPTPRVCEVGQGMLNSIGIPSKGIDDFLEHTLPFYRGFATPLVASVSAPSGDAFAEAVARLDAPGVAAIEANISCPNIEEDGKAFAMDPRSTAQVVAKIRRATKLPVWVKLSPNTGDVASVARAAEDAGADALVVANTILAMSIDIETFRPRLGNVMGGLSGPAVKPIVVRMVYQCARVARIPVIGCGGISTAADAVEYMLAGASAVQVGTATFVRPTAMLTVIDGLIQFCARKGFARVADLTGAVHDADMTVDTVEVAS
ncbi:MAG: dihydroorotate dehydrogenase [Rhodoplanes sp.]|uniref:dihydroorotate dehydrogenase n=1 Tax=Rhodoplanes sp. TaxID=1968906 RepID=UPI0017A3A4AE|nr:dihydroorotate dehydrogenase [Rhodoplanes sp.]NVO13500.1 dihydroorotate dehydrogenase [Rhodoplanes sp.]